VSETIAGRDILLISSDDFEAGLKTSKHQLTALLVERNRVLFIESIGLRRPTASGKDVGRIKKKIARFLAGPQRREENLWVFTPLVIPLHDQAWARRFNAWFMARCVRQVARQVGFRDPLLWMFLPSAAGIVGRCGESCVIYYNVDDFSQFSGSHAGTIQALDDDLTRRADIVFSSSQTLADQKRALNPNTYYSPHGVDYEHFRSTLDGPAPPADAADLRGPVIGYWGWVADYFDLDAVCAIADRADWTVLLIGESTIDLSRLVGRPNVRILGSRPYAQLPAYAALCDVLLIPRLRNPLTERMNPLKLREYLATGRPVVSSPLPEVAVAAARKYGTAVRLATTPAEWVAEVADLLATPPDPAAVSALVADETWEARLAEVWSRIERSGTVTNDGPRSP